MIQTLRRALVPVLALALLAPAAACHKKPKAAKVSEESILTVSQLWEKGEAAMKKGHNVTARRYFDQITLREDAGDYKDRATLAIADSYFEDRTIEGYAEAISRYQTFLSFHPTHEKAPYCQYRIALSWLQEMSSPDRDTLPAVKAQEAFRNLIENYPQSSFVPDAQKRLAEVVNILAAHEIKVGDFYLKDGKWEGAAARYRVVVDKYPTYWNMPLVHFRLAEALAGAGRADEAKVYYRLVVEKASGTELAQRASRRLERLDRAGEKPSKKDLPNDPLLQSKKRTTPWWKFWKRHGVE